MHNELGFDQHISRMTPLLLQRYKLEFEEMNRRSDTEPVQKR